MSDGGRTERAGPPWGDDPLGFLLAPVTGEEFFARLYERAPLLSSGRSPDPYAELLTLEAVDAFIDGADLRHGMLDVVGRPPDSFIAPDGRIMPSAVAEAYLNGATIVLPHLHASMPRLGDFCRALEGRFSAHVQANVYLTPAGQQGFPTHYDEHDSFILQVSGSKAWRFYGTPVAAPLPSVGFQPGRHDPGEFSASFTLGPGDCAYVPRGLMHDAANAGDEPSLHITIGLITRSWADLMLEAVAQLAAAEPAFRRSLPPGYADAEFDRAAAESSFADLKDLLARELKMEPALGRLADAFRRERRPKLAGIIAAPGAPRPRTRYRRRTLVPCRIDEERGKVVLIGPGGDVSFDDGDAAALRHALSGEPFCPSELPCRDPVRLFRKLWANGYLEAVL